MHFSACSALSFLIFVTGALFAQNYSSMRLDGDLLRVGMVAPGVAMIYGTNGVVLRTTNNGAEWKQVPMRTTENFITFATDNKGECLLFGSDTSLFISRDWGVHWDRVLLSGAGGFVRCALNLTDSRYVLGCSDGKIYTYDSRRNELSPRMQDSDTYVYDICCYDSLQLIAVSKANILHSDDGGITWASLAVQPAIDTSSTPLFVSLSPHSKCLVVQYYDLKTKNGYAMISNDTGASWSRKTFSALTSKASWIDDSTAIVGFGLNEVELISGINTSSSTKINRIDIDPERKAHYSFINSAFVLDSAHYVVVGTSKTVYVTSDKGTTWRIESYLCNGSYSGKPGNSDWTSTRVLGIDNWIYASHSQEVFHTTNGGDTWLPSTFPEGRASYPATVTNLIVLPKGQVVVNTTGSTYYSSIDSGLTFLRHARSSQQYDDGSFGLASLELRKVYRTTSFGSNRVEVIIDSGRNWTYLPDQFKARRIGSLKYECIPTDIVLLGESSLFISLYYSITNTDQNTSESGMLIVVSDDELTSLDTVLILPGYNSASIKSNGRLNAYIIANGYEPGAVSTVYETRDAGTSWKKVAIAPDDVEYYSYRILESGFGVRSGKPNIIEITKDHGKTWRNIAPPDTAAYAYSTQVSTPNRILAFTVDPNNMK